MIHYHGVPFSGRDKNHMALSGKHVCVSFAAPEPAAICAEMCQSLILDNGAFSAWKIGKPLDIPGFMSWAKHWLLHPAVDWALIPDVIDGDEAANDALLRLVAEGSPRWVPVWHLHESLDRLWHLCFSWPRVAFGSSGAFAQVGTQAWRARMAEAMTIICDSEGRPSAKLHGLRMLDPRIFSLYPFSSADSTNVARNIGIDKAWDKAPYAPASQHTRAIVLMERIERHASASHWSRPGEFASEELFG